MGIAVLAYLDIHISAVHGDRVIWHSGTIVCDNNEKNIKRTSEEIRINKRTLYSNANQQMGRGVDTSRVRCS